MMNDPLPIVSPLVSSGAFTALWQRCGCAGSPLQCHAWLLQQYQSGRAYHNLRHIGECLLELQQARAALDHLDLDAVEMALWFHDVVYDTRAADNEERSAHAALFVLKEAGAATGFMDKVQGLILATKHHAAASSNDPETALMVDIDLSILGKSPERFREYDDQIRVEYHWAPLTTFASKRCGILTSFLQRETLFQTAEFRARYETQARLNLQQAVERWTKAAAVSGSADEHH